MKRKLRILWCLIVPVAVAGAILYVVGTPYEPPLIPIAIVLGTCTVLNLPMGLAAIIQDACDSRLLTLFTMIAFAPIWLLWNWFTNIKSLIKGRSGIDWLGGKSGGGNKSNGDVKEKDTRSSDNTLFGAMNRAISSVRSDSSNYPDGSYVRVSRNDVNYVVTRMFGIKIYGTVTYQLTNYNMTQYDYEQDINDALEAATNRLIAAAERAVENVREKYKGFDNEWDINVELQGKVSG